MAAKKKKTKLVFIRTVMHDGKTYLPESTAEFDKKTADILIEKGAAEPYVDFIPDPDPDQGTGDEGDQDTGDEGGENTGGTDGQEPEKGGGPEKTGKP